MFYLLFGKKDRASTKRFRISWRSCAGTLWSSCLWSISFLSHSPLVDDIQFKRVLDYIEHGKMEGAKVEVGGNRIGDKGYFIEPTLFTGVKDEHKIAQEEIFGPVVCMFKFKTIDEVVERANNTEFGLAAAVHTKNVDTMYEMQRRLEAGTIWCNCELAAA